MTDWSSYAPADFLLFSPRVYERLFEIHNAAWWPAHLVALAAGAAVLASVLRPTPFACRAAFAVLGLAWLFVAWAWFFDRYQTINWAAAYVWPFAAVEGLLLLAVAAAPHAPAFARPPGLAGWLAVAVLGFAIGAYPLAAAISGRAFDAAQVFAIMPDPTAIATLAALAVAEGRLPVIAMAVPLLWAVITAITLATLGWPDWFVAPALAAVAVTCAVVLRVGGRGVVNPR